VGSAKEMLDMHFRGKGPLHGCRRFERIRKEYACGRRGEEECKEVGLGAEKGTWRERTSVDFLVSSEELGPPGRTVIVKGQCLKRHNMKERICQGDICCDRSVKQLYETQKIN